MAIEVPSVSDVDATAARLRARGLDVRTDGLAIEVDDPWGNLVRVEALEFMTAPQLQ